MLSLSGKKIAVGVTGGIAAYKACEIVSSLKKLGADVFVVMTKNAAEFVKPLTFEVLSNNRVTVDMFDRNFEREVEHISLAKKADLFLIAPATANFVAKFALGIADDFLSTTIMAARCPIVLAPAMNTNMLTSPSYKANEKILRDRGVHFIDTETGVLACKDEGDGRLASVPKIVEFVVNILSPVLDYKGKTVLITAGATSEPIDPVRFITNRSSGKMGMEIAKAACNRGAKVIFICGKINYEPKTDWEVIRVNTTVEMFDAVTQNYKKADVIIKAAAPSDYRTESIEQNKIKSEKITLKLVKNPDIAESIGKVKENRKLIVFAAETENLIENAKIKLKKKNADMVVANDVLKEGAGFNTDTNIVSLITKNSCIDLPIMKKSELADIILDKIAEL